MDDVSSFFTSEIVSKFKPLTNNLFEVAVSYPGGVSKIADQYPTFHCSSVSFNGSGVEFSRHKTTRMFFAESYQPADEVTIKWRESADLRVFHMHEAWQAQFYDRETDKYLSTKDPASRYRKFVISIQSFLDASETRDIAGSFDPVPDATLTLIDVLPARLPSLEFDWSQGSAVEYSLTYKVSSWKIDYSKNSDRAISSQKRSDPGPTSENMSKTEKVSAAEAQQTRNTVIKENKIAEAESYVAPRGSDATALKSAESNVSTKPEVFVDVRANPTLTSGNVARDYRSLSQHQTSGEAKAAAKEKPVVALSGAAPPAGPRPWETAVATSTIKPATKIAEQAPVVATAPAIKPATKIAEKPPVVATAPAIKLKDVKVTETKAGGMTTVTKSGTVKEDGGRIKTVVSSGYVSAAAKEGK